MTSQQRTVEWLKGWYRIEGVKDKRLHAMVTTPTRQRIACGDESPWNRYTKGFGYGRAEDRCSECIDHLQVCNIV